MGRSSGACFTAADICEPLAGLHGSVRVFPAAFGRVLQQCLPLLRRPLPHPQVSDTSKYTRPISIFLLTCWGRGATRSLTRQSLHESSLYSFSTAVGKNCLWLSTCAHNLSCSSRAHVALGPDKFSQVQFPWRGLCLHGPARHRGRFKGPVTRIARAGAGCHVLVRVGELPLRRQTHGRCPICSSRLFHHRGAD
jgi:hypothetical protein